MSRVRLSRVRVLAITVAVVGVVGCGGSPAGSSSPAATTTAAPRATALASPTTAAGPNILPIIISSEILAGRTRFLFSLTDRANKLVAAPEVPVTLEVYNVDADPNTVVATKDARFAWGVEGLKGLYVADMEFPTPGRWGVRFTASFPDGRAEQVRADFDVAATGSTPAIGTPAIPFDTPTVSGTPDGNLKRLSSDTTPDARFYQASIAEAVSSGDPFVVAFATPAFCQTAMCGPMLENLKAAAEDYPRLTFINVEPYRMTFTDSGLQPELDASGNLQAAAWTDAWGLRTEPWIFVVDGSGKIAAKFEAVVGDEELRAALDSINPKEGSAEGLVLAVDQPALARVESFTLRTDDGQEIKFGVGKLDMSGGSFNAGHLREHMALASRIRVDYVAEAGQLVATRLSDAE